MKDRDSNQIVARVVETTNKETLQGFISDHADADATIYTDDAAAYTDLPFHHETVNHSVSEFVRDMAHTNGIESFWSMLKRGYTGVYHHISAKHLQRYIAEYAGRHNVREEDTMKQMEAVVTRMVGKRIMYQELVS